jgi:hypothetical protein
VHTFFAKKPSLFFIDIFIPCFSPETPTLKLIKKWSKNIKKHDFCQKLAPASDIILSGAQKMQKIDDF